MLLKIAYAIQDMIRLFEPVDRWLFVKLVVVAFIIASLVRLVPKKPRHSDPRRSRRVAINAWTAASLGGVIALSGCAYIITIAEQQLNQQLNAEKTSKRRALLAEENDAAHAKLIAEPLKYLGVLEPGAPGSYRQISRFAALTASHPKMVLYYSGWGERFQAAFANDAYSNHAVPFVQITPYNVSLNSIARGRYDNYLREYAASVRRYRHAVAMGFAPEMNGNWYPWGYQHASPAAWVAAWRHIVHVFRANGADNVTWVWSVNIPGGKGTGPIRWWWPGKEYVTWVGIDGYFVPGHATFAGVIQPTYESIRAFTHVPVLISETGIAPGANKVATLRRLFRGARMDRMLGFVYFDENQPANRDYHYDWRLENDPAAIAEYRQLARAG